MEIQAPTAVETQQTSKLWKTVGKAWLNQDKKGRPFLTAIIGNRTGGTEQVGELKLQAGDRIFLRPNNKREGRKDADYQLCVSI